MVNVLSGVFAETQPRRQVDFNNPAVLPYQIDDNTVRLHRKISLSVLFALIALCGLFFAFTAAITITLVVGLAPTIFNGKLVHGSLTFLLTLYDSVFGLHNQIHHFCERSCDHD